MENFDKHSEITENTQALVQEAIEQLNNMQKLNNETLDFMDEITDEKLELHAEMREILSNVMGELE